jgi:diguanylate cyclase (GGDEF)-like protein
MTTDLAIAATALALLVLLLVLLVRSLVRRRADVMAHRLASAEAKRLAYQDPLTGLPNLRAAEVEIGKAIKQAGRRRMLAVHFLDVDHFKQINDTYGHTVGDTVLAKVARRLDDCVREGDTVARFSEEQNGDRVARLHGDEFMVIQYMVAHRSEAERLKQRLVECLSEPITVGGRALRVTVSSGFGLAPREAETVEDLKRIADAAMYREKAAKRQHGGMGAAA